MFLKTLTLKGFKSFADTTNLELEPGVTVVVGPNGSGKSNVVDAIGWDASLGYGVDWVPSMRMVVDLADLDASRWVNLTGASGHAFHEHYVDQAPLWQRGETRSWAYSPDVVAEASVDSLTLTPAK